MDINRQEPEQVKVQITLSGQEIATIANEISTNKKYSNMPVLQEVVEGIIGGRMIPIRYVQPPKVKSLMNGKRYHRITKDHVALALDYLRKHKDVKGGISPWMIQNDRVMGWNTAVRSLESLVRSGHAQCIQRGKRRHYFLSTTGSREPRESRISYPTVLKDRVNNTIQANGMMYMKDIAKSIRMTADEKTLLRGIIDELVGEGKIKDIHETGRRGGWPRYAPIDFHLPFRT